MKSVRLTRGIDSSRQVVRLLILLAGATGLMDVAIALAALRGW